MAAPFTPEILPDDAEARREFLEQRARPNGDGRPRLDTESEKTLAVDASERADAYMDIEETTYRLHRVARRIDNGLNGYPVKEDTPCDDDSQDD